jgi:diaminopimelate epimerase
MQMVDRFEFMKMHGAGNDFIMIADIEDRFEADRDLITSLCDRHRGIGADGLILLRPSRQADFRMRYYNSDGGEAELCGNGARCTARFALVAGIAGPAMSFETGAGRVEALVDGETVRIDIGEVDGIRLAIRLDELSPEIHFAVAGVPHAAAITADARGVEQFLALARKVRYHETFSPDGANFNLVTIRGRHELVYRTYERGVEEETLACGTGAVAVSVITAHLGLTESPVTCETSGGDRLVIEFEKTSTGGKGCRLTGPAVISFRGSFRTSDYRQT